MSSVDRIPGFPFLIRLQFQITPPALTSDFITDLTDSPLHTYMIYATADRIIQGSHCEFEPAKVQYSPGTKENLEYSIPIFKRDMSQHRLREMVSYHQFVSYQTKFDSTYKNMQDMEKFCFYQSFATLEHPYLMDIK